MTSEFKIFKLEKKKLGEIRQEEITVLNPINIFKIFETYEEAKESLEKYIDENARERADVEYTILKTLKK